MATIGDINLEETSTITKRLAAVSIDRNSTTQFQEVMVLGSPNSTTSLALAEVLGTAPASTVVGLAVRIVSGPSTATDLPVRVLFPSTAGDNPVVASITSPLSSAAANSNSSAVLVRVVGGVSSAVDFLTRANQGVGNSSLGDRWLVNAANSSAQDYVPVRISNGSTFLSPAVDYTHGSTLTASTVAGPTVLLRGSAAVPTAVSDDQFVVQWGTPNGAVNSALVTSSGANLTTNAQPSTAAYAVLVRQVVGGLQVAAASTVFNNSTGSTLVSSAAATKPYVYAIMVTSTVTSPITGGFYDGATLKWPFALSSGYGGYCLAVSPPAYLFVGSTGSPMVINQNGTTNGGVNVAMSYWLST